MNEWQHVHYSQSYRLQFQFIKSFSVFLNMAIDNILENIDQNSTTEWFLSLADDNLEKFSEANENEIMQRKTQTDVVLMVAILVTENKIRSFEDWRPSAIDAYSSSFLWSERKKSGSYNGYLFF